VRDVGSALILSASGFILGPFVYFGHEKAWEYFGRPKEGIKKGVKEGVKEDPKQGPREGVDLPALPLLPAPR
jgi:hypothetical protein